MYTNADDPFARSQDNKIVHVLQLHFIYPL